ncbi:MAG: glycosyltransferase family 4 protein [Chloroflexota bacterium]|mgnify:CR=1 FL=1
MKILVVGNYYYPEHMGGVEVVSYNLVKYYRIFGHSVRWVAADVSPNFRRVGDGDIPIRAWNITEEKFGFPHPMPRLDLIPEIWDAIHWCDVLHLQDSLYPINIMSFIFAKLLGKPILLTQYAKNIPYEQYYKRILQKLAYRTIGWSMFNFADRLVFITETVRSGMAYLMPNADLEVVPLGVDTEFYKPMMEMERTQFRKQLSGNEAAPIILFVGRLVERKGVHLIRPLIEKYQNWFWVLVGRPDDFNPADWKLPNLIHLQDVPESELRKLFASSDVLVHPSVGEGVTLTVSNSLACGTPVLISQESLYELGDDVRNLFFAIKPATHDIEEKLKYALSDFDQLKSLGVKCREFAIQRLSWKTMCERYCEILLELKSA